MARLSSCFSCFSHHKFWLERLTFYKWVSNHVFSQEGPLQWHLYGWSSVFVFAEHNTLLLLLLHYYYYYLPFLVFWGNLFCFFVINNVINYLPHHFIPPMLSQQYKMMNWKEWTLLHRFCWLIFNFVEWPSTMPTGALEGSIIIKITVNIIQLYLIIVSTKKKRRPKKAGLYWFMVVLIQ